MIKRTWNKFGLENRMSVQYVTDSDGLEREGPETWESNFSQVMSSLSRCGVVVVSDDDMMMMVAVVKPLSESHLMI
jgi:hypothetical protein